jgi:hypothetical protein
MNSVLGYCMELDTSVTVANVCVMYWYIQYVASYSVVGGYIVVCAQPLLDGYLVTSGYPLVGGQLVANSFLCISQCLDSYAVYLVATFVLVNALIATRCTGWLPYSQ